MNAFTPSMVRCFIQTPICISLTASYPLTPGKFEQFVEADAGVRGFIDPRGNVLIAYQEDDLDLWGAPGVEDPHNSILLSAPIPVALDPERLDSDFTNTFVTAANMKTQVRYSLSVFACMIQVWKQSAVSAFLYKQKFFL